MNLFTETKQFAVWFARLNKVCLSTRPFWTIFVIGATVVSTVAKLLAFLLPLKVVLLAGSEGVPRYFAFFIDAASKDAWIIGLAAGAIISYLTHLSLDSLVQRMALVGGNLVARKANKLALVGNQERTAQRYYSRITGLTADGVFLLIALSLITLLLPQMMVLLGAAGAGLLLLTAGWLALGDERQPTWPESNAKLYSNIITSALFLIGFLLIVYPYIQGNGPNILFSLIAIVLLKRCSKVLHSIVTGSASLVSERTNIDPLMFRGGKVIVKELQVKVALRDLFQKKQRQILVQEHLKGTYIGYKLDVLWKDQRIKGLYNFKIVATPKNGGPEKRLRLHAANSRNKFLMEREYQLFKYVDRQSLLAPELLDYFKYEDFVCSILYFGNGRRCTLPKWRQNAMKVLQQHWSLEPPARLLKDYKLSHSMIWRRLDESFIERVRVAVDREEECEALNYFISNLGFVQQKLARMPLYVANEDMSEDNAAFCDDEGKITSILFWGRWAIEPIGYYLPGDATVESVSDALKDIRIRCRDIGEFDVQQVLWINKISGIEKNILRGNYREALTGIEKVADKLL